MKLLLLKAAPTEAQAKAGNYKKRRVPWRGLEIAVENEPGSTRSGTDPTGKPWSITMANAYGYLCRTLGVDGDEFDCYLGPDPGGASMVYVVTCMTPGDWDKPDEQKAMIGFPSEDAAMAAFLKHYDDPRFLGPVVGMPADEFVEKVKATRKRPALIKSLLILKAQVGSYIRDGRIVSGYQKRRRAAAVQGQQELFDRPKSSMKFGDANPYKGKDPVLDTPDLFTGETRREAATIAEPADELVREHKRLVAVLRSPSHDDDRREADRQERELHEYEKAAARSAA